MELLGGDAMRLDFLFLKPEFWLVLLVVPLVWFAMAHIQRIQRRSLVRKIGPRVHALVSNAGPSLGRRKRSFVTGGTLFLSISLMQPTWGDSQIRVETPGLDLMICLDISKSMLAEDSDGSRLGQAKKDAVSCINRLGNGRVGLVVYAGEARLLSPLTRDHDAVLQILRDADIAYVFRGGTNSNAAIALASQALAKSHPGRGAIVLLSDGEDQGAENGSQPGNVSNQGVYCVGYGTRDGAKIPIQSDTGTTFLKDGAGHDVVSVLAESGLQNRARTSGGIYVAQEHRRDPLVFLLQTYLLPRLNQSLRKVAQSGRPNRYQWPLFIGILLLSLEMVILGRPRK